MDSSKSGWEKFFKEAGIPGKLVSDYANVFCDNRMRLDMLEELNKEVLQELGIKAVGDIIAILRYSKTKQKELSRNRSPSPDVEVITKKPVPKAATSSNKMAAAGPKIPPKSSNLSMTVKASDSTSSSSSSKSSSTKTNRKTLSQRFNEYEKDAKQKKVENEEQKAEEKQTNKQTTSNSIKNNTTVFTIQLPSKPPSTKTQPLAKNQPAVSKPQAQQTVRPQKVTLVPAQGKTLNRNKQSTSIFDRLDRLTKGSQEASTTTTSSTSTSKQKTETIKKTVTVDPKQDVFSRLGTLQDDEAEESPPPKNVFSRLGGM